MNKLVACLALTTSAFGASAFYFHGELAAARARHGAQPLAAMAPTSASAPDSTSPAEAIPTNLTTSLPRNDTPGAVTGVAKPPAESSAESSAESARKVQAAAWSADFLKKYADPAARPELRAFELSRLANSLAGLDREIKLDAEGWAKLRELMVDYELEKRAIGARCAVDPGCVKPDPEELEALNARKQAIRDFLGDQNYQALEQFRSFEPERNAVAGLQGRLPTNLTLSAKQAEALATAMHEEREAQTRELASRGQMPASFGMAGISVVYPKEAATPEQSLQSAQQYLQRVRDRAALVLNAGQLTVFSQMQDDTMVSFRRFHRQQLAQGKP